MKSYEKAPNKRKVRQDALRRYGFNSIVGLAGPNIKLWLKECSSLGFLNFKIYENNPLVAAKQMDVLMNSHNLRIKGKIDYSVGDIINADIISNTVYDLDFCKPIEHYKDYVRKFKHNFVLTVSEMQIVRKSFSSITPFLTFREESLVRQTILTKDQIIVESNKGKYLFTRYYDTSQMMTITEI